MSPSMKFLPMPQMIDDFVKRDGGDPDAKATANKNQNEATTPEEKQKADEKARKEREALQKVFKDVPTLAPGVVEKALADIKNNSLMSDKLKSLYVAVVRRFTNYSNAKATIQSCPPELLA